MTPEFDREKRDVVIYHRATGQVTTVVDWNLSPESALYQLDKLTPNLHPSKAVMIVPMNSANVGSIVAEPEQFAMPQLRTMSTKQRRRADCQCIRCGSPDLATRDYCQSCAEKASQRSARSNRESRAAPEVG